ncbi:MAG: hypothetical protein H6613_10425 [Ignavibacteriales bacterium]|nr:hypothetical protein [Ignavibacteriota bacterium]MCB9248915.1 hypothetical protein [Ignavibacteriales bacterium]
MSKMLLISSDFNLNSSLKKLSDEVKCDYCFYDKSEDPLDIISEVLSTNARLIILDDDFIAPASAKLLESIKKVKSKLSIIFITSDSSLELGRTINNIGVKFYLIKPISEENLREFIKSVRTQNQEQIY